MVTFADADWRAANTKIAARDTQEVEMCFSSGLQIDILRLLVPNSLIQNSLWFYSDTMPFIH